MSNILNDIVANVSQRLWEEDWDAVYPEPHNPVEKSHMWDTCFAYEYRKRWSEG